MNKVRKISDRWNTPDDPSRSFDQAVLDVHTLLHEVGTLEMYRYGIAVYEKKLCELEEKLAKEKGIANTPLH